MANRFKTYMTENADVERDLPVYAIYREDIVDFVNANLDYLNTIRADEDKEEVPLMTVNDLTDELVAAVAEAYREAIHEWIYVDRDGGIKYKGLIAPSKVWDITEEHAKKLASVD